MMLRIALLASVLLVTSCATQQPRIATTKSGHPEAVFSGASIASVKNKLIQACDERGATVSESSDNAVVCEQTLTGSEAAWADLLLGDDGADTPQRIIRFTLYKVNGGTKVSARQWLETNGGSGQIRKSDLNSNNQFNDTQQFLYKLGGK